MKLFFSLLPVAAALAAFFPVFRYHLHMFQLNSYHGDVEWHWMLKNKSILLVTLAATGAAVLPALFLNAYIYGPVGTLLLCGICLYYKVVLSGKKAKKPLVFTDRVKRLTLTSLLLLLLPLAVLYFAVGGAASLVYAGGIIGLMPIFVLLANSVNKPVESGVRRHYINDARRMLKEHKDLKIIGITGSYGKTSLKYFVSALLSEKYNTLMTPDNFNTPMGVVRTVREHLSPLHQIFVCEMGAKRVGEIKELCDLVHPQNGVITSVGPQHLETFGSQERVRKTKFELARALPKSGTVFLNADSPELMKEEYAGKAVYYSLNGKGDYNAENIRTGVEGTSFTLRVGEETAEFSTGLIGRHNVLNIVGAIAVAHHYGVSFEQMKPAVKRLKSVPHRLELIDRGNVAIIDDAYNSNPEGAKAALDTLSMFEGYRILVTPGMVELGEKMAECNKDFGRYAAAACDFVILVGKKQAEPIMAGLKEAGFPEEKICVADKFSDAISVAYRLPTGGKKPVILLENDLPDNF